ncbi:MAG TPA: succinate dehydrogenase iron-sulfur subunit [Nitrososphaeraceae archaeon]|jgi:succinate dehydrogenase / fumarate reductase iron-sulfur subunit
MANYIIEKLKKLNKGKDKDDTENERVENTSYSTSTSSNNVKKQKQYEEDKQRNKIILKIFRVNFTSDKSHHYDKFEVPLQKSTTVLDALIYAKSYLDNSIAIRYSCRMASCGSCGMRINGVPRLACYTNVSEFKGNDTITCEPLANFPHIRDLVTDFSQFSDHHKQMKPYIHNENADISTSQSPLSEFGQSPEDVDKYLQFSYCIKCGLCYSACPTVATDMKFPGPQALAQAYRYYIDTRDVLSKDRLKIIDDRHGIWRCHFAGSCSKVCPKGVDPALGIQLLRDQVFNLSKHEKKIARELGRKNK